MITNQPDTSASGSPASLAARGAFGGVLMGLANLVPGISGGTMLLAAGVYPGFINGIAEITTFRFRFRSLLLLGSVIIAALAAIVLLAGPVKELVVHHRWVMYSIFIGLTLGGVPIVWRMISRHTIGCWLGVICGFAGMAVLAVMQTRGGGGADREGFLFMFLAGAAGASAMILPGVSGGYLLLVLGVYVPLLAAIAAFKDAIGARDTAILTDVGLNVILPVGLGVIVGVVGVSNLLRLLLKQYKKPTLGFLLGLLLGAVVGLWPFQAGVQPKQGDVLKGQTIVLSNDSALIYEESGKTVEPEDWPTAFFQPRFGHIGGAVGLIAAGFLASTLVARFGNSTDAADSPSASG